MSTPETPHSPKTWADEAPTEGGETPAMRASPSAERTERTSKELCKRCGGRAAARCVGCGEAFCKACVNPISASAPDVSCRECALRIGQIGDGAPQRSPVLLEQVLVQCLARLSTTTASPLVHAMRKEALDCQGELDSWRTNPPSLEVRGAMRERVLALRAKVEGHGG